MRGRIELICGPMFSGKTTMLIDRLRTARDAGAEVLALKPADDTRYSPAALVSHLGASWAAVPLEPGRTMRELVGTACVIAIDEIHFFDLSMLPECQGLVEMGVRVVVAGVDLDHRGERFPIMSRLIELADEVQRLTATCARCGGVAEFSQRLFSDNRPIVVGGVGAYEPRCVRCFEFPK